MSPSDRRRRGTLTVSWARAGVLLVAALAAGLPLTWFAEHAAGESRQQARETVRLAAEIAARHADHVIIEAFFELEVVAQGAAEGAATGEALGTALANFNDPILILDSEGRLRNAPDRALADDESIAAALLGAAESSDRNLSSPFLHPLSGHPTSALSIPLFDAAGERTGTVVGLLDLEQHLEADLRDAIGGLGPSAHADLIGPAGALLASTTHAREGTANRHPSFYQAAAGGRAPVVGMAATLDPLSSESSPHVMAYSPLGAAPWGVAVGASTADIYRQASDLERLGARLLIPAAAVLGAAILLTCVRFEKGDGGRRGRQEDASGGP